MGLFVDWFRGVAQVGRQALVAVSVIVFVLEVADDHSGFAQVGPVVAVEASAFYCPAVPRPTSRSWQRGVPPAFRTADQIGSDPEGTRGIGRKICEIQTRVS